MKYLIINCHPYQKSFNYTLATAIVEKLNKNNSIQFIDLIADNFNPVMSAQDLNLWRTGNTDDQLVKKYMNAIQQADEVIFTFPVWWGAMPAILKGFCDKVLLPNFAYKYDENHNLLPNLTGKKAIVISTMEISNQHFNDTFKNPIQHSFLELTLNTCGFKVEKHFQIDSITSGGKEYTTKMFNKVLDYFN